MDKKEEFLAAIAAAEKMIKPWRVALIATNAIWCAVFALFILLVKR